MIKSIETHALLSTPPEIEENLDGWLLRSSSGSIKRCNAVSFLNAPATDMSITSKIDKCEAFFTAHKKQSLFRLTPLTAPEDLEGRLTARDYIKDDVTDVRILPLVDYAVTLDKNVVLQETLSDHWMAGHALLTGKNTENSASFISMTERLQIGALYASIVQNGHMVASAFATLNETHVGLFGFATDPACRRQGLAQKITYSILAEAKNRGIKTAYLQVEQSNPEGQAFWHRMGFKKTQYTYAYMSKNL
jgi:ribosomal protein S18 acetylase RimI-like enzyme